MPTDRIEILVIIVLFDVRSLCCQQQPTENHEDSKMIDDDAGDADTMVILSTTAHGHHDGVTTDLPYIYMFLYFVRYPTANGATEQHPHH